MQNFFKQLAVISILVFTLVGLRIFAFSEPSAPAPGNNTPTPLNVGSLGQSKLGGLILNTGGALNGLIVQNGNVGIGTVSPGAKLDVNGPLKIGSGYLQVPSSIAPPASPAAGMIYLNTADAAQSKLKLYRNSHWVTLAEYVTIPTLVSMTYWGYSHCYPDPNGGASGLLVCDSAATQQSMQAACPASTTATACQRTDGALPTATGWHTDPSQCNCFGSPGQCHPNWVVVQCTEPAE